MHLSCFLSVDCFANGISQNVRDCNEVLEITGLQITQWNKESIRFQDYLEFHIEEDIKLVLQPTYFALVAQTTASGLGQIHMTDSQQAYCGKSIKAISSFCHDLTEIFLVNCLAMGRIKPLRGSRPQGAPRKNFWVQAKSHPAPPLPFRPLQLASSPPPPPPFVFLRDERVFRRLDEGAYIQNLPTGRTTTIPQPQPITGSGGNPNGAGPSAETVVEVMGTKRQLAQVFEADCFLQPSPAPTFGQWRGVRLDMPGSAPGQTPDA